MLTLNYYLLITSQVMKNNKMYLMCNLLSLDKTETLKDLQIIFLQIQVQASQADQ